MEFIKTHWIALASGVVGVLAIVVASLGMTSTAVVDKMKANAAPLGEISSLRGAPQNADTIKAELDRAKAFDTEFGNMQKKAEAFNRREPLIKECFPRPARPATRFAFQEAYIRRLADFPNELGADDLPNDQDRLDAREELELLAAAKKEREGESSAQPSAPLVPGLPPIAPPGATGGGGKGGGGTQGGVAPPMMPQGPVASMDVNTSPEFRAMVRKARNIRCYVGKDYQRGSLHVSPIVEAQQPPNDDELWYAQVGLWIQDDVLKAVKIVNDAAAGQLRDAQPNVEHMPIKRVELIRVFGYVLPTYDFVEFPTKSQLAQQTGGRGEPSFTQRVSEPAGQFDVVRYIVTLVIDQREIPHYIDTLTRLNLHQLISIEFDATDASDLQNGYLYGSGPTVRLKMQWEAYFARKVYEPMMPEDVKTRLGIAKAEGQ